MEVQPKQAVADADAAVVNVAFDLDRALRILLLSLQHREMTGQASCLFSPTLRLPWQLFTCTE